MPITVENGELHLQHSYLTMGQIHSALAYYYDHEDELSKDIEHRLQKVAQYKTPQISPLTQIMQLDIHKI